MRVTAHKRKGKGRTWAYTDRQADEVDTMETSREAGRPPTVGTCELACVVLKQLAKYHPGGNFHYPLVSSGCFEFIFTGRRQILEVDGKTREELSHTSTPFLIHPM